MKSTFEPAGNIARGPGDCLTLGRVSAARGTVTASGTARGLFENHFRVVLRNALGQTLASRAMSASGHWSVTLRFTAPHGQRLLRGGGELGQGWRAGVHRPESPRAACLKPPTIQDRDLAAAVGAIERNILARRAADLLHARERMLHEVESRYLTSD